MPLDPKRYPNELDAYEDIQAVINEAISNNVENVEPFLTKDSKVVSLGSCFASNIAKALAEQGYSTFYAELPEVANTTFATLDVVEAACSQSPSSDAIQYTQAVLRENTVEQLREHYQQADVFIITIGVAWITCNPTTREYVYPRKGSRFNVRLSTLVENVNNLKEIISLIESVRPNATIVLTVSPVPGVRGYPGVAKSPYVADCLSKSIMRITALEACNIFHDQITYWPSFEMVRWLGSHTGPVFGQSDGHARHPNQDLIAMITESFISKFSVEGR